MHYATPVCVKFCVTEYLSVSLKPVSGKRKERTLVGDKHGSTLCSKSYSFRLNMAICGNHLVSSLTFVHVISIMKVYSLRQS